MGSLVDGFGYFLVQYVPQSLFILEILTKRAKFFLSSFPALLVSVQLRSQSEKEPELPLGPR